jgi:TonB-dependent receptor
MDSKLDLRARGMIRWLGATSLAVLATGLATSAHAQTEEPQSAPAAAPETAQGGQDADEIVVTGFRGSLAKALNVKRSEAAAVDTILAEDIGKFPDLNLSESIQRIPGVALARDGGEGRQITVRGLGPQFTRVRINGMEALTSAGGSDASGGTNRGRSFDFNVFASDLFNSITVRKTAEASTDEGSLGATVDLRTARPFDYRGFTMVASAQASYNDLYEKVTPRGAFLISDRFAGDTLGALISVAYTKRKLIEEGFSTVRWAPGTPSFNPGFQSVGTTQCLNAARNAQLSPLPAECATVNSAQHPRFPRYDYFINNQERIGATASLQWQPTDATSVSLDALYASFKGTREERYLEAPSFSVSGANGLGDTDIVDYDIQDGVMVSGTFNDVDLRVEDRLDHLKTVFKQLTFDASHRFGENVTLSVLAGHSVSNHKNPIQNTLTFDQTNVDNYSYDYGAVNGRTPVFDFGTARLTDPTAWVLSQIRLRAASARNEFDNAQAAINWKVNDEFTVDVGASYKNYHFSTTELRRFIPTAPTTNQETVIPAAIAATPLSQYSRIVSIGGTEFLAPDYRVGDSLFHFTDPTVFNGAFLLGPGPALGNNNRVREEDKGAFAQFSFQHDFGGIMVRGNAGVRYVQTNQAATGFVATGAAPNVALNEVTVSRKYDDWLPAANVVIEPARNLLIRLSASQVMSRPNLNQLVPGATINVSGANRTVSAGNPFLDPFRAASFDAAIEWYFQPGGLLSLALFQKNIDSFTSTSVTRGTFNQNPFGLPDSLAQAACSGVNSCDTNTITWTFTSPINSPGGPLRGFEVNYQQPFKFLPSFLSNTGVLLNFTRVNSKIKYLNSAGAVIAETQLTGLSKKSANATLYYEDKFLSARISGAYRSKYLTQVPASESGNDVHGNGSTFNLDASVQLTINDHFKLSFEAVNLTDQYQTQYVDSRGMLSVYHHTGREFLAGVRYTF